MYFKPIIVTTLCKVISLHFQSSVITGKINLEQSKFNIPKASIDYDLDAISLVFSKAQKQGTDAALESFTDLDASIRQYIQNTDASQLSISGLNKHLEQQASAAQKTAVKTQLASTALNGLLSFGINAGIGTAFNLVSSAVSYLLN